MQITGDLRLLAAVFAGILGIAGVLALRGPLRFLVLILGLLLAAYLAGLLPSIRLPPL
jgi:hypothetical protein